MAKGSALPEYLSGGEGTSGTSGIDGTSGSSGGSGISGSSGTSGTSFYGVTSGTSGTSFYGVTSGTSGINGTSGTSNQLFGGIYEIYSDEIINIPRGRILYTYHITSTEGTLGIDGILEAIDGTT